MGSKRPTEWEQKQLVFHCHYCGKDPGEWCVTKTGNPVQWLHGDRHYQARDHFVQFPTLEEKETH
jgi:hypothetical protein